MPRRNDALRFREEAERCRRLAEAVKAPHQREHWLRLPEEYEKLAVEAERMSGR